MNRLKAAAAIAAAVVVVVVVAGRKCLELDRLAQTPDPLQFGKPRPAAESPSASTLDSAVGALLAKDGGAANADGLLQLRKLVSALEAPDLADDDLAPETAEPLAQNIVALLEKNPGDSKDDALLRRRAVGLLAGRVPSPSSKAFILKILTEGPQDLREEAVARVGSPRGVRGPSVYAKISELAGKGLIPDELLPQALRRTGGLKARAALTALMTSTDNVKLIAGCAVALQDYRDPAAMGGILDRLEQAGLLDSAAKLPWISAPLLDAHMKTADDAQFRRGLTAMSARPSLARIAPLRKGLDSPDARTRRLAAVAVRKAALAKVLDAAQSEALLAGRLQVEKEPVLIAELTGGLESVRGLLAETKARVQ